MRTLILMRHGKSDWNAGSGSDHARPLKPRGEKAARRMGRLLTDAGLEPGAVITSTARRASDTADLALEAGGWGCPVTRTDGLYDTTAEGALAVLRGLPDEAETVVAFGHEPTTSSLASSLIGGGALRVVTAAIVGIELGLTSWQQLGPGLGELRFLVPPRLLD